MTAKDRSARKLEELFNAVELPQRGPVRLAIAIPGAALLKIPGFPRAARPVPGRMASGRGFTATGARTSALREAAELVSCSAWGDEQLVSARDEEIGPAVLSPEVLNGFTAAQLGDRIAWNERHRSFDWRPPRRDPATPIDWLAVEDAYGGPAAYVPADFAFIGRKETGDESAVAIGDSNGCACGADIESARHAALLELIESDASTRWWYGRRRRPLIDLALLDDASGLVTWLGERERDTWLFDITSDLGVPVAAAASSEPDGSDVALGFAARPDMREAGAAALTEMVQMEFSLATVRALGPTASWAAWRQAVTMALPPLDAAHAVKHSPATKNKALWPGAPLEACARADVALWFADMTRDVVGVPAVRAISPDLCHFKPRFARKRLLAPDHPDLSPVLPNPEDQVTLLV
ncbi:hypothetical protein EJ066_28385 [Mesorhizobium sp. M9A.F.Ca.ET.002.03.1.2]|uniref:YcaO-like family protein n=1 Tax=Mesorhizobium sp. M9A.F.Ca.ET.002.03.1.2 TaxID=2493668 RepID=UPI000F75938B|nr:YcaO-like family protein [Mesorhizobium sp. M9A.F.Ca.ET.002.03.1.2]AZO00709.1 hypothetical protein EJ066_28385 [Mesorhizobium sp. M9A.F.Ca.ET.002.03.1.2]